MLPVSHAALREGNIIKARRKGIFQWVNAGVFFEALVLIRAAGKRMCVWIRGRRSWTLRPTRILIIKSGRVVIDYHAYSAILVQISCRLLPLERMLVQGWPKSCRRTLFQTEVVVFFGKFCFDFGSDIKLFGLVKWFLCSSATGG